VADQFLTFYIILPHKLWHGRVSRPRFSHPFNHPDRFMIPSLAILWPTAPGNPVRTVGDTPRALSRPVRSDRRPPAGCLRTDSSRSRPEPSSSRTSLLFRLILRNRIFITLPSVAYYCVCFFLIILTVVNGRYCDIISITYYCYYYNSFYLNIIRLFWV